MRLLGYPGWLLDVAKVPGAVARCFYAVAKVTGWLLRCC